MEVVKRIDYDVDKSSARMDEILGTNNNAYEETNNSIPTRNSLSYTNGYYMYITALFIDIVGSSDMTNSHTRPVLAKTYRSFISECTAIMNSNINCEEISINGDCVWGVFHTQSKRDIDTAFETAAKLNSLISILNYKLQKKGYSPISVGIGMDYGRALMVKAGYSGSGLNDVIWMGDVVNSACHLCGEAGRNGRKTIIVSESIYINLNDHNQKLLSSVYIGLNRSFEANVVDVSMNQWYKNHCN